LGSRETTFISLLEFDRVVAVVVEIVVLSDGAVELVHPASARAMTTIAMAPSLRTVGIYTTGARSPVRRVSAGRRAT
jgi:hypothetical protein